MSLYKRDGNVINQFEVVDVKGNLSIISNYIDTITGAEWHVHQCGHIVQVLGAFKALKDIGNNTAFLEGLPKAIDNRGGIIGVNQTTKQPVYLMINGQGRMINWYGTGIIAKGNDIRFGGIYFTNDMSAYE